MRILIFATPFYPRKSGLGNYVLALSKQLTKKGHDITILCYDTEKTERYFEKLDKINIFRVKTKTILNAYHIANKKHLRDTLKRLDEKKFDLIMTNTRFFESSLIGMNYAKKRKIKWIHIEHGTSFVQTNNPIIWAGSRLFDLTIGKKILDNAKTIVAISKDVKQFVQKISKNNNIIVIPNGIEFKTSTQHIHKEKIKNIVFVGRIIYGKGIQDLIKSIKNLDIHLTIIGDGPYLGNLKKLTSTLKIENKITFMGELKREKVNKILPSFDLFINPSYSEGLPTTVLEAGMAGLPVIATDVGGTREIIINRKTGILIKEKNLNDLKKAIIFMINNKKERKKYTKNSKKLIKNNYSWEKIIEKWKKLIKETKD